MYSYELVLLRAQHIMLSLLISICTLSFPSNCPLSYLNLVTSDGKEFIFNAEEPGSTPGSERSSGEGDGNLLQSSCL